VIKWNSFWNFIDLNFSSKIYDSSLNILGLLVKICPAFGNSGCIRDQEMRAHKLSFLSIHVGISEDTRLLNLFIYLDMVCIVEISVTRRKIHFLGMHRIRSWHVLPTRGRWEAGKGEGIRYESSSGDSCQSEQLTCLLRATFFPSHQESQAFSSRVTCL
jgi:hypothetical protein